MPFNKPLNCTIERYTENFLKEVEKTPETRPSVDSATRAIIMILDTMTTIENRLLVLENLVKAIASRERLDLKTKFAGDLPLEVIRSRGSSYQEVVE